MKKIINASMVVILSALMICPPAFAGGIGTVTYAEGRVDILRSGATMAQPVREGEEVAVGDAIRTKSGSKAEVTFADKTVMRLAQNSKADVKDYQIDKDNKRITANIMLERGKARTIIAKMPDSAEFVITTPNAEGVVKGSDIYAFYQAGNSGMLVADGKMSVVNLAHPEDVKVVTPGNSIMVPQDELPSAPRPYFELEKKFHEQDTNVPPRLAEKPESSILKGVIIKMAGDVRITTKGAAGPHAANINEILGEGDKVETGANGLMEIRFDNGNSMNLKQNTNLTITKLTIDLATMEYDNLFESSNGKIRARIENLKGKSRFEVKTPTAVSGARGTIMYLDILPNATKAFFEGGGGFLKNLASGIEKIIDAGQNATADGAGNTSDPVDTPEGDRESFGEGWDPGTGAEGYSAPGGGGTSVDPFGADLGLGANTGPDTTGGLNGSGDPVNIPITESGGNNTNGGNNSGTTPPPGRTMLTGEVEGSFGEPGEEQTKENFIRATLRYDNVTGDATLDGEYANDADEKIWSGDVRQASEDGGLVGRIDGSWNSWEGVLAGIFVDPEGIAGTAFGFLSGETNDEEGTFEGNGGLLLKSVTEVDISPEDLINPESGVLGHDDAYGYMNISFDEGEGYFRTMSLYRDFIHINGQNWGIWETQYTAEYERREGLDAWGGMAGGGYNDDGRNYSYFIGAAIGTDDLASGLRVDLPFVVYLDTAYLGTFYGTILGSYSPWDSYYFDGIGCGVYGEEPLTFSGRWADEEGASLFYNRYGSFGDAGEKYGLIGSTLPSWWLADRFNIVAMGEYYDRSEASRLLWNSHISSTAPEHNSGGAFFGCTTGTWHNGLIDGSGAGIFVVPGEAPGSYDAGFFRGPIEGDYFSDIEMWLSYGTFTPEIKERNIVMSQEELGSFSRNLFRNPIYNLTLEGTFNGVGSIKGYLDRGESLALREDSRWGIYNLRFGNGNSYSNPDPQVNTNWSGVIGGSEHLEGFHSYTIVDVSGTWKDGIIKGGGSGWSMCSDGYMGIIESDFYGVNINVGGGSPWIGASIGTWEDVPLAFNGSMGELIWADNGFGYYDSETDDGLVLDYEGSYIAGLLGGTETLWGEAAVAILMGEFYVNPEAGYRLWAADFFASADSGLGEERAALFGTVGGVGLNGLLRGILLAFYVRPVEDGEYRIGYVSSEDIAGSFYNGISMFGASGPVNWYLDMPTTLTPEDIMSGEMPFDTDNSQGVINGDISGTVSVESAQIFDEETGQEWGLWRAACGGEYEETPSEDWQATISGIDKTRRGRIESIWSGVISGDSWSDDLLSARIAGISADYDGLTIFEGTLIGTSYGEDGYWEALACGVELSSDLAAALRGEGVPISAIDDSIEFGSLSAMGSGNFRCGHGSISVDNFSGITLNFAGEGRGVWGALADGTYSSERLSSWKLTLCGELGSSDNYWLGTLTGHTKRRGHIFSGDLKGVWFAPVEGNEAAMKAGIVSGKMGGEYIEVEETSGTWRAAGAGEWVEVTELLDPSIFGANGIDSLAQFVSVPVTEVYSNMLAQAGAGSIESGFSVADLSDFLNFAFRQWESNNWAADYSGRANGIDITGQAGGPYGDGKFDGVGAGINGDILNTVVVAGDYSPDGTISNASADVTLYTNTPPAQP